MANRSKIPLNYSLAHALLDILLDFGENVPVSTSPKKLWRKALGYPQVPCWRLNRALRYLEELGQIKIIRKGREEVFAKLTHKGKLQALLQRIGQDFKTSQKWDGKWRVVIWDIPETAQRQRNQIRYFLKGLGFHQLQQSVFIIPHSLPQSAVAFLEESGLTQFIRFLRVDRLDNDQDLRKHFGL